MTRAGGSAPKPAGLEFELVGEQVKGSWQVRLLRRGKPVADAPIAVLLAGAAETTPAGRTNAEGRISYKPAKSPVLFTAEVKDPPPSGAKYDSINYTTSLYVQ